MPLSRTEVALSTLGSFSFARLSHSAQFAIQLILLVPLSFNWAVSSGHFGTRGKRDQIYLLNIHRADILSLLPAADTLNM